ncbi:hypothetical protein AOL_s00080g305 [Orbilia oligospora ATCC 24927]|uniref:F-box domain-containing protein n=2 Tax=Orbilia oligospora TaxID=2813651 RepID=G1XES0_ARTOA|nr:hypothetical protein AOL_s00080g305 [Orbilia oligospora ATCC 24927]EGX48335.1 hypothetical protein AOL_s00080g305 [Orbilia oligospora ATCC 24927]KAF3282359.1 hypothetical protein TWF970_001768 [Orbilia oligospora]
MPKRSRHRPLNPNATLSMLPPEILEQILIYFPAKTLLTRHRLVCKRWNSLLTTSSVLKYYSTTSTYHPTTERQIRWYQYSYDFNPLFVDILYQLWKRLVPLWSKYQEPTGGNDNEDERDIVNAGLVREIEVLYLRYLHIFSIIPMIHPVYRETRRRIAHINWGEIKSRSVIVSEQEWDQEEAVAIAEKYTKEVNLQLDKKAEKQEEDKEKEELEEKAGRVVKESSRLYIPFAYSPRSISFNPSPDNSRGLLVYLCRFMFMSKPAYNSSSSSSSTTTPPEMISTRINIKVYLAWANQDQNTEVEGRTLSLLSTGSNGNRPVISKFDINGFATTIF